MPVKINGATSGSVTLAAPATGSDVTLTLPGVTDTLLRQGGGKILQIVRATDTTSRTTTSTSFTDVTGVSVTITPQRSDSAVLLIFAGAWEAEWASNGVSNGGRLKIADSSNNTVTITNPYFGVVNIDGTGTRAMGGSFCLIGYATPSTTSAVTYKLRFATDAAVVTFKTRNDLATAQAYAIEVSA